MTVLGFIDGAAEATPTMGSVVIVTDRASRNRLLKLQPLTCSFLSCFETNPFGVGEIEVRGREKFLLTGLTGRVRPGGAWPGTKNVKQSASVWSCTELQGVGVQQQC